MEKFYIIRNQKILDQLAEYKQNKKQRNLFIKKFFEDNGIDGDKYYLGGNGFVNIPFDKREKSEISLYIIGTENNLSKHGKDFKKKKKFDDLFEFKKTSALLKKFQDECVENQVVINLDNVRFSDYFTELTYRGYGTSFFELDGEIFLKTSSSDVNSITPAVSGFDEIKGSVFYSKLEELEKK